jgi:adenylate kinase family enzyme
MIEINIIGSTNSGKSIIAKLIAKTLSEFNIDHVVLDEIERIDNFENESAHLDTMRIKAIRKKYNVMKPIKIKMIQSNRESINDNKRLSSKE